MKKLLLLSITFLFAFTANVFAQTNTNVGVTADVTANLTITATDVALGSISQGSQSVLNPSGGTLVNNNVGTDASLGTITLSGFDDTNTIAVSFTNATLDRASADSELIFTPAVTYSQGGSADAELGSGDTITASGTLDIILSIGGTLDSPSSAGTYSTALGGGSPIVFTLENTSV